MSDSKIEYSYNPKTKKVYVEFIGIPKALLPKGCKCSPCWVDKTISLESARKMIAALMEDGQCIE